EGVCAMMPNDPVMLLSYLNLKLRDFYPSLEAFCEDTGEDMEKILDRLSQIDYHYDKEKNQFV
ncbi:MAG: DUF4250 domain-containing protein, partial [Lachnospiraceae bacterium]|nr:DUF4250 domain-containing protein [Lachnospiraceae bacterium]